MGRKNKNVRQRNIPRAAQPERRTQGAQFKSREHRVPTRQPTAVERVEMEMALYNSESAKP